MRISTNQYNQRGLNGILDQQGGLSAIQLKIASGKKFLSAADDPAGAAQVLRLRETQSMTEQYQGNITMAINRLTLEETVLANVENSLLRIRELALQANSSNLTDTDRQAIAVEMDLRLDEIKGLANSKDSNGDYLFAGFQTNVTPFSQLADSSFVYNGDQGQHLIQINDERRIADSDSGMSVFMDIINGNGTFQVQDNPANTGDGIINPGTVRDFGAYVQDTYTISFVTNSSGNLAYNIVGANTGQVVPTLPANPTLAAPDYKSGASIVFNGIDTDITGVPFVGDSFTISPSNKQDIFKTVSDLTYALKTVTNDKAGVAKIMNEVTRSILDIDQAFNHMTEFRATTGARLNTVESQQDVNESFLIEIQATASEIEDLDLVAAITELQTRSGALEAALATFSTIIGLSLFNEL